VNLVVRQGPYSVTVSEPYGRFDELEIGVRNGVLTAARKDFRWRWGFMDGPNFTVTVTAPTFTSLTVDNHADMRAEVSAEQLELRASNHADLNGRFNVRALRVSATNHADIRYSGACADLFVRASNHADIQGRDLDCATVNADATNHADIVFRASRSLTCEATNHADVWVYGEAVGDMRSSNHGSIHRYRA
jgi:hypothetical protein